MTVTDEAPAATSENEPDPETALPVPLSVIDDLPVVPGIDELRGLAALAVTLSAAVVGIPPPLRGRPNDVLAVLLTGRDLGLSPMAALRGLDPIQGVVSVPPETVKALVHRNKLGRVWKGAETVESCTWHAVRADDPDHEESFTFTWDDAVAAELVSPDCKPRKHTETCRKGSGKLPWPKGCRQGYITYPKRMLSWRALGYLLSDVFSEVGTGLYSAEEMGAVVDERGRAVIDVEHTEPLPGTKAPRGHASSGEPPDPRDAAMAPADLDRLKRRVQALAACPGANADGLTAREALVAGWTRVNESTGERFLPDLPNLLVRHAAKVEGLLRSIEQRATKGEWGAYEPAADPETGEVRTPEAAEAPESPLDAPETGAEPKIDPPDPEAVPDAPTAPEAETPERSRVDELTEWIADLDVGTVTSMLAERGIQAPANPGRLRGRLLQAVLAEEAEADRSPEPAEG